MVCFYIIVMFIWQKFQETFSGRFDHHIFRKIDCWHPYVNYPAMLRDFLDQWHGTSDLFEQLGHIPSSHIVIWLGFYSKTQLDRGITGPTAFRSSCLLNSKSKKFVCMKGSMSSRCPVRGITNTSIVWHMASADFAKQCLVKQITLFCNFLFKSIVYVIFVIFGRKRLRFWVFYIYSYVCSSLTK